MKTLTKRQQQVLELIANEGLTDHQIGTRLGISEGTVGVHLMNAIRRIGLGSRTQAAAWAWHEGWLYFDDGVRMISLEPR